MKLIYASILLIIAILLVSGCISSNNSNITISPTMSAPTTGASVSAITPENIFIGEWHAIADTLTMQYPTYYKIYPNGTWIGGPIENGSIQEPYDNGTYFVIGNTAYCNKTANIFNQSFSLIINDTGYMSQDVFLMGAYNVSSEIRTYKKVS